MEWQLRFRVLIFLLAIMTILLNRVFFFCFVKWTMDRILCILEKPRMFKKDLNSMLGTTNPRKKHIIGILLLFLWEET